MAVYTDVTDEQLDRFLASYDLGSLLSFKGIAEGVQNSNFFIHTEQGQFILTLFEKLVKRDDLPYFLGLMEHLAGAGLTCPTPVHDRAGEVQRTLAGRPAALFTFLEGVSVSRPDVTHCRAVGRALAKLHLAAKGFKPTRPNSMAVGNWRDILDGCGARAGEVRAGLLAHMARELDHVEAHWPADLPRGVIHADLFSDNVFFLGGKLSGIIDFYFACNDLLAYDVAICLNAWCFEPDNSYNITKGRALLRAYHEMRPLSEAECDNLALLARGAALRFLLTRTYDWLNTPSGALVRPKDPMEYFRKLNFHQRVESAADYGLEQVT